MQAMVVEPAEGVLRVVAAVDRLDDARDRDLIRRVARRDEGAFLELFRRYAPTAKALATRVLRQPFMAEEVVQEAFMVLWRNPGSYREERGSVRSWLLSTVHHRAVDMVRREETQRRRTQQAAEPEVVRDVAEAVAGRVDMERDRVRVRAALDQLPAEQRLVLERMYFEGKTQVVISREEGIPLGTVKSRTLLAMRRLRSLLWGEP